MAEGWIKLYRSIQDHWIWQDPQKLKWWLDILILANHKSGKFLLGDEVMILERGEHHTSELKLADRWKVDRKTVRRFLSLLEKEEMISLKKSPRGTTIKVNKYADYQAFSEGQEDSLRDNKKDNTMDNHRDITRDINNNDKNVKNVKNVRSKDDISKSSSLKEYFDLTFIDDSIDKVKVTKEQYDKLASKYGNDLLEKKIIALDSYISNSKKSYKDHYKTLNNWCQYDERSGVRHQEEASTLAYEEFQ